MPKITALLRRFAAGDFARHGAIVFASTMAVNVCNYGFHFYMTRHLGPTTYGALSSLLALTALLSLPAAILTLVVVKYASELHAADDRAKLRTLSERIVILTGVAAAAIFLLCGSASSVIAHYLQENDALAVWLVGLVVAVGLMNPGLRGILQGTQDFKALAIAMGVEGLGKCVLGVAFAAAGLGLRGALIGYVLGCILSLGYAVFSLAPYRRVKAGPLHLDLRRLLQAMLGIGIATIILQIASYYDVILVKHYFAPQEAGIYSAVALAGKIVIFFVAFVPSIVLPKAAARAMQGQRATSILLQGLGLSVAISLSVLLVMFAAPSLVMRVFSGAGYLTGAKFLPLYAVAMTFLAAASTVANYQIALHRFHFIAPLSLVFAAEVGGMVSFHASIHDILLTLVLGNAALFGATFYAPSRARISSRGVSRAQSASAAR